MNNSTANEKLELLINYFQQFNEMLDGVEKELDSEMKEAA